MKNSHSKKWVSVVTAVAALAGTALPVRAVPPQPFYGTATVDGLTNDWTLVSDFFANMHRAGKIDKELESKLYLRYDCSTATMFALILTEPGIPAIVDNNTAWIAIDTQSNKVVIGITGDDGFTPDFAWVGPGYDGDPLHALGYEASFFLGQGNYEIIAHVNVFDDGNQQTSGTIGFPSSGPDLEVECLTVPTAPTTWSGLKAIYR